MNANDNNSGDKRRPDLLAGYIDGELGPADRALVEAWIAEDSSASSEFDLQSRLSRQNVELWQKVTPPMPSEDVWNRVLGGIHQRLAPATPAKQYRTGTQRRWSVMAAALAAMVVFAIGVNFWPASNNSNGDPMSAADALVLVHGDDVKIIDVVGDDSSLVIGRSPLTGAMDLVAYGDTELWAISTEPSEPPTKPAPGGDPNRKIWWNTPDKTIPVP